jgi:hypothetical protein
VYFRVFLFHSIDYMSVYARTMMFLLLWLVVKFVAKCKFVCFIYFPCLIPLIIQVLFWIIQTMDIFVLILILDEMLLVFSQLRLCWLPVCHIYSLYLAEIVAICSFLLQRFLSWRGAEFCQRFFQRLLRWSCDFHL